MQERARRENLDSLVATAIADLGPLYGRFHLADEGSFDRNTASATFTLRLPGHSPIVASYDRDSRGTWSRARLPICTHGLGRSQQHAQWALLPEDAQPIYVLDLGEALLYAEEVEGEEGEEEDPIPF